MKFGGTMKTLRVATALWVLICAGTLSGCSNGSMGLGPDGSFHPDGTAGIAAYTGQGEGGEGWAGDSSGEGGPSAELPTHGDLSPR
jgi:predicted small secreted protein